MPSSVAVILDMDGLMLDTERVAFPIWRAASAEVGFPLDDAACMSLIGLNAAACRTSLMERFGASFPFDTLYDLAQTRYQRALETHGVPHKPGLVEFLQFLDARAIARAVATSTARDIAVHKLRLAGVSAYLETVVGGDEVARGKPAPDMFLLAAAKLDRDRDDCVVLEDSGPGMAAATAAGMRAILVPDLAVPSEETRRSAFAIVASLAEARAVLETLL